MEMDDNEWNNSTNPRHVIILTFVLNSFEATLFLFSLLLNLFAFYLHVRYGVISKRSGIPILFILESTLASSRVAFHVGNLIMYLVGGEVDIQWLLYPIAQWSLTIRNWWMVMVTFERLMAIYQPRWYREVWFTSHATLLIICGIVAVMWATMTVMKYAVVTCSQGDSCHLFLITFITQIGVPVPLVLTISVTMIVLLYRLEHTSELLNKTSSTTPIHTNTTANLLRKRRTIHRASYLTLTLALCFSLLETPTLVFYFIFITMKLTMNQLNVLTHTVNLFIALDSFLNYFIILGLSMKFKRASLTCFNNVCCNSHALQPIHPTFENQEGATEPVQYTCTVQGE